MSSFVKNYWEGQFINGCLTYTNCAIVQAIAAKPQMVFIDTRVPNNFVASVFEVDSYILGWEKLGNASYLWGGATPKKQRPEQVS